MLKIGEFAWLSQVTVETLRHYDRIGLLKPLHLDLFTGYRYYSLEQLPRLNRILALKDLGLSLNGITRLVNEKIKAEEIRGILQAQRVELEGEIQAAQRRLARVEARLQQIEMEGKMPEHEVLLKTVEAQWIASRRETIPAWDQDVYGPWLTGMFDEDGEYLDKQGIKPSGPGIALYHENQFVHSRTKTENPDVEAALPVAGPMPGSERVQVRELPATEVAFAVHRGSFAGLSLARQAIFAWIEGNGYRWAGPVREVYLHFDPEHQPNADSPRHITEVQVPVVKA